MSPLNRGPLLGPRMPAVGMRPPLPRFGGRLPMPGMPQRMPLPIGPMFGPMRQRMMPPRPVGMMRPGGPPPLFGPRGRGVPPLMPPMMGLRGMGPRGPLIRPGPRGILPPQGLPHMRPRFPMGNGNIKMKAMNSAKKASKLEELELKKPWMTDEIRNEIQKKNKLYAKAKKNKDAKEWDEFKDLRNKVTRMIRDAKNEYLANNPEQAPIYKDDKEPYDQRDENYVSSEDDETSHYCEVCDREFNTAELLGIHTSSHRTCDIDGCVFSAHPKLVEKHISMQHCTGLYHRMKNLSTPEDIQKWIAERKKKYPTKINVEQKNSAAIEKRERGELIEKQSPKRASSKPDQGAKRRKVRKRKPREYKEQPEPIIELYRGLRPFAGTANLPKYMDKDEEKHQSLEPVEALDNIELLPVTCAISDEEDEPNQIQCDNATSELPKAYPANESPAALSTHETQYGLASLVANYGTDSEDGDAPDEVPIKRIKTEVPRENEISDGQAKSSPTEFAKDSETTIQDAPKVTDDNRKNQRFAKNKFSTHAEKSKRDNLQNTGKTRNRNQSRCILLQRLLSRSIQHERNLICQCIKYIADNNFFVQ